MKLPDGENKMQEITSPEVVNVSEKHGSLLDARGQGHEDDNDEGQDVSRTCDECARISGVIRGTATDEEVDQISGIFAARCIYWDIPARKPTSVSEDSKWLSETCIPAIVVIGSGTSGASPMPKRGFVAARAGTVPADVTRFFIEIAIADERREALSVTREKKLRHVLHALTVVTAGTPVNDNYEIDIKHVGYVKRELDDCFLFIPFHLGAFFPTDEILGEVLRAARALELDASNPICISGSATFLGASRSISDLDYCEYYVNVPKESVADRVVRKWLATIVDFLIARTECLSSTYVHPWPDANLLASQFLTALSREPKPSVRIDGIYLSAAFGPLPASNLVLLVDRDHPEEGSATKSFVFQEAVLVRNGGPPRALVNSVSLGAYLNFLRKQAEDYIDSDPLKSLKRALCFFLLTDLHEPAEVIVKVLQSDAAELLAVAKRQAEVDLLLNAVPPEISSTIASSLDRPRLPDDTVAYALALVRPWMEALATEMLGRIKTLYAGVA